ncbi:MAG: sulfatase-like hydrolase/transferase [Deltaproteobacteria bacterium]|jgi:arylsulfatase A-like enzyme|nr:sulfatase-like hydrolase/transferase [Deltaproteobacteria bacterium]MBW2537428.1 sulfatase-like hydrolase/transferase [Deltaproteobacteria bacterium]
MTDDDVQEKVPVAERAERVRLAVARHVALAGAVGIAAGLLIGVVGFDDAMAAQEEAVATVSLPRWVLVHVGLVGSLAVMWGLVQGLLAVPAGWLIGKLGITAWWERCTSSDRSAPREPVVGFYAAASAGWLAVAAVAVGLKLVIPSVWAIQIPEVAHGFLLAMVALSVAGALVAAVLLAVALLRPLRRFDRWRGLPWPRWAWLRATLFVLAPAVAFSVYAVSAIDAWLDELVLVFLVPPLLAGQWTLSRLSWPERLGYKRWVQAVGWLTGVAMVSWGLGNAHRRGDVRAVLEAAPIGESGISLLRTITDVDGDSFSSFFGGNDCAAFDGQRHPIATDVPDNGIDEDCDGSDARTEKVSASEFPQFLGDAKVVGLTRQRYNVVWFFLEAIRADHCSFLGYERPTTPFLDELAQESLVFTDAHTPATQTLFSVSSMLYGADVSSLRWELNNKRPQPAPGQTSLADRLADAGYRTVVVTEDYMIDNGPAALQGFAKTVNFKELRKRKAHSAATAATVGVKELALLVEEPDKPFFMAFYTDDPHRPYDHHDSVNPKFGEEPIDRYDEEVAYVDRHVGMMLTFLRAHEEVWKNTIVVVNGDHGEEFGEHGSRTHGRNCYGQSTHVPLLVRIPGIRRKRVDRTIGVVNVAPTLLDLTQVDPGKMNLTGHSLLLDAFGADRLPDHVPVVCFMAPKLRSLVRAVRFRGRVLHEFVTKGKESLHDIKADPEEQKNLLDDPKEARNLAELRKLLKPHTGSNIQSLLLR